MWDQTLALTFHPTDFVLGARSKNGACTVGVHVGAGGEVQCHAVAVRQHIAPAHRRVQRGICDDTLRRVARQEHASVWTAPEAAAC